MSKFSGVYTVATETVHVLRWGQRAVGQGLDDWTAVAQKRSKHYVRFGRSPVDVDEYFYDEDDDNNNADGVAQSWDFISRRSPRRHYVRFGRDSSNGRHYIRFGRNSGEDAAAAAKRASRHYVRFGRDEAHQQNSDDEKRVHYVRFGRGGELGIHETDSETKPTVIG